MATLSPTKPPIDRSDYKRFLLDEAPVGVAFLDTDLRYIYVNKNLSSVNGVRPEEHIGKTVLDVIPTISDSIVPVLSCVISTGSPVTFELRQVQLTQTTSDLRDWLCNVFPVRNTEETIVGVGCVVTDITASNEADKRLKLLSENIQDIISIHKPDGTILYVSPSCEAQLGYMPEEMVGRNSLDFVHVDDLSKFANASGQDCNSEKVLRESYRIITKAGQIKWFEAISTLLRDENGSVISVQVSARDITERVSVRSELKDSEARLRVTIESMADGLILRAADGKVILVNDAAEAILGLTKDEISDVETSYPRLNFIYEDGNPCRVEDYPFFKCLRTGLPQKNDVFGTKVGGDEIKWIAVNSNPLFREGETRPYAIVSTLRDITERKKLQQERIEQRTATQMQQLSDRLIAVQEHERRVIAADLHDEIGGALTGLKLLLETTKKVDPALVLSRLDQATSIVQEMIAEVRQMSMDLRPTIIDYSGLIPALEWYFQRYTSQTGIQISFRVHKYVDRLRPETEITLYRFVQEALTNIARYASVDRAVVSITKTATAVKVSVRDHGIGFDAEAALRRNNSSGLAGMRERLRLVRGELKIVTSEGRGTRLIAELPISTETEVEH